MEREREMRKWEAKRIRGRRGEGGVKKSQREMERNKIQRYGKTDEREH